MGGLQKVRPKWSRMSTPGDYEKHIDGQAQETWNGTKAIWGKGKIVGAGGTC